MFLICRDVCHCSYLHAKQIIHRDLKSNSIFFSTPLQINIFVLKKRCGMHMLVCIVQKKSNICSIQMNRVPSARVYGK